jgi:signal transduction histidine kinase
MKRFLYQKLNLSKSFARHSVVVAVVSWLLIQIPVTGLIYVFSSNEQNKKEVVRRDSLEKVLGQAFSDLARAKDFVYSRGFVVRLGSEFGLKDIGVCSSQGEEIVPRPFENRCKDVNNRRWIGASDQGLWLDFVWNDEEKYSQKQIFGPLLISALSTLVLMLVPLLLLGFRISSSVSRTSRMIEGLGSGKSAPVVLDVESELKPLIDAFLTKIDDAARAQGEIIRLRSDADVIRIAKRVAHDIRSPLAALSHVAKARASDNSEGVLLREAVARIRAIADDLLAQSRRRSEDQPSVFDCVAAVQESIALKRQEGDRFQDISIDTGNCGSSPQVVLASRSRFLSVISNVLNNSVEAVPEDRSPKVRVLISRTKATLEIRITDNGKGFPPEVIANLGRIQVTVGKVDGNGIGLLSAHQEILGWGGSLKVETSSPLGSTLLIQLPLPQTS